MSCLPHLNALWQNGDAGWGEVDWDENPGDDLRFYLTRQQKSNKSAELSERGWRNAERRSGWRGRGGGGGANGNLFWCIDIDFVLCPREEERDTNWQNKSNHSCPNKGRWSLILPYFYFTIFALLFIVLCIVYKHIYEIHWFINHFLSWSLWRREIVGCSLG